MLVTSKVHVSVLPAVRSPLGWFLTSVSAELAVTAVVSVSASVTVLASGSSAEAVAVFSISPSSTSAWVTT